MYQHIYTNNPRGQTYRGIPLLPACERPGLSGGSHFFRRGDAVMSGEPLLDRPALAATIAHVGVRISFPAASLVAVPAADRSSRRLSRRRNDGGGLPLDHLYAPVLGPPVVGSIGRYRRERPNATWIEPGSIDTEVLHQHVDDGGGPFVRQLDVVIDVAH